MSLKLPLRSDIKPERCAAWKKHTDGRKTTDLAREVIAKHRLGDEEDKMSRRLAGYRRTEPSCPDLPSCVQVEHVLALAKGQIYKAIAKTEQDVHQKLEETFGPLPLRYNERDKQYYGMQTDDSSSADDAPGEVKTLGQLDYILRSRNIRAGDLQAAIGRNDITWQRIAAMRRRAKEEEDTPVPEDMVEDLQKGLQRLSKGDSAAQSGSPKKASSTTTKRSPESKNIVTDELRISGFGGVDIVIPAQVNVQELQLEDGGGNVLVQDGKLIIPPIPLSNEQRKAIRTAIAQILASQII